MLNRMPRPVDGCGRITIPKHYRRLMNIYAGDLVYVYMNEKRELVISSRTGDIDYGTREDF